MQWCTVHARSKELLTIIDWVIDVLMICLLLQKEHLRTSRVGVAKFIAKYNETGSLMRKPGSGRPSKITPEMKAIVEAKMREDDEGTAYQLYALLVLNQF